VTKLYLFDLDGTLIERDRTGRSAVMEKRWWTLRKLEGSVAIVTNQLGVAHGKETEEYARAKIDSALRDLELDQAKVYVCFDHERGVSGYRAQAKRRKPSPSMLHEAMRDHGVRPAETIFVGDSDSDREAAEAAGVEFAWARDFFGTDK
jgi:HAD superfamily hydrolase (TIGR01662 family)